MVDTCMSVICQFGVKFEVFTGTPDDDVTPCHLVGRYRRLEAATEFPQYKNFVKIHSEPAVASYRQTDTHDTRRSTETPFFRRLLTNAPH